MKRTVFVSMVVLGLAAATSVAQVVAYSSGGWGTGGYRGYGWGYRYPWGQRGVAAYESRARGTSELIRARAEAEKTEAEVERIRQDTKQERISNLLARRKQLDAEKEQRLEAIRRRNRQRREERLANANQRPPSPGLTADQIDLRTGDISWPLGLDGEAFAADRKTIEDAFARRASLGTMAAEERRRIALSAESMRTELRKNIKSMSSSDFLLCRHFLRDLEETARTPG